MYGPYPMGGRTNRRVPRDDPLDRYLRTEHRGTDREAFLADRPTGENGEHGESAVRRLVKIVLLNLRRVKPVPVATTV